MTSLDMMRRVIDAQVDNDTDVDAVGRQIEPCLNERRSPGVALAWEPLGTRALAVCDHDGINIRVLNIYLLIDILGHMVLLDLISKCGQTFMDSSRLREEEGISAAGAAILAPTVTKRQQTLTFKIRQRLLSYVPG